MAHRIDIPTELMREFVFASSASALGSKQLRVVVHVLPRPVVNYEVRDGHNSTFVTDDISKAVEAYNAIPK